MTEKIFWQDCYLHEIETSVATVQGRDVTLSATIFYAFSGGQESDSGTIADLPVEAARKDGLDIVYSLPENHGLMPGQRVTVKIDGARRQQLMRLHFAAEIILELTYRLLPGVLKIGAHISADKARLDFELADNIAQLFPELERLANELVSRDLPIESAFSDEASQKRYWSIDGFARVACGGTHPKSTGEVGRISLKRKNIGKAKERIEISVA